MLISLVVAAALGAASEPSDVATELWQVAPDTSGKPWVAPAESSEKKRAVVLVHGLHLHPIHPEKVSKPWVRDWQEPKSELAKALAADFDVFALSYAQTATVDEVAKSQSMRDTIARVRKAGYKEIVLVGHSAGGVIVRQFVESNPDSGVTKVIAVAAPFAGVELANVKVGYPKVQAPFVRSLSPDARAEIAKANKVANDSDVPFACVVCKLKLVESDGLVPVKSQWPDDLQKRGIPIVEQPINHFKVMKSDKAAKVIAELAREKLVRWSPEETEKARKVLFDKPMK